jgi:hypothetical protein
MTQTHAREVLLPHEDSEESEAVTKRLGIQHVAKDLIIRQPVVRAGAKVIETLIRKTPRNRRAQDVSMRNLDPSKSDDLIRICRRHDIAFHSKNLDQDVAVVVEIMEHQRYNGILFRFPVAILIIFTFTQIRGRMDA